MMLRSFPSRLTTLSATLVFVLLGLARCAWADEGDCNGYNALSDGPEIALGRITDKAPRTYFVRGKSDVKSCPAATVACRAKAFLVPGDRIMIGATTGAFVCVDYVNAKGVDRAGWLPAAAVGRDNLPPVVLGDWIGEWTRDEANVKLKPGTRAGTIAVRGDATYGALDPDRVKRGAVNIGEIEGSIAAHGADLSFTMGANATLPVTKGDETDCKVWMRRLGPYLLVDDNNQCGGMNVTFRGIYMRKG